MKPTLAYSAICLLALSIALGGCSDKSGDAGYAIGDVGPGGGTVFYITEGGAHGMEAAPASTDWSAIEWGYDGGLTYGTGTAIGTGSANTASIVAVFDAAPLSLSGKASQLCAALVSGGYDDWFMPSKDELHLMYTNLKAASPSLGGFADFVYFSSSEFDSATIWLESFTTGGQGTNVKGSTAHVRAARAF